MYFQHKCACFLRVMNVFWQILDIVLYIMEKPSEVK